MKKIRVIELFAGVGGFRLGLEAASDDKIKYEVVWSSQWEPSTTTQHASEIYELQFGSEGHSNEDIQQVIEQKFESISDHDMLVGGFPCQDYSVASTLNNAKWLIGKKGVLWWSIYNIVKKKGEKSPDILLLENVDRLLKSPASQRGRDFAIMLASLADLGYIVEWRVINAADYGLPQRRRRVFILAYKKNTKIHNQIREAKSITDWIQKNWVIATAFPVKKSALPATKYPLKWDLSEISQKFSDKKPTKTPFEIAGVMIDREVYTMKVVPEYVGDYTTLWEILIEEEKIPEEFFIDEKDLEKWNYLKWGKNHKRTTKDGFEYDYSEWPMTFPDPIDKPSRTIVTGEGWSSPSRFKHVIKTKSGRLRRLMPEELEQLNMFPKGHTKKMKNWKEVPDTKRAFLMWNALVVGVVKKLGKSISNFI
jgi:DNA (cytosine-5)-methyltransferase 1